MKYNTIQLDNLRDGEHIYQRCVLVSGCVKLLAANAGTSITVSTSDEVGTAVFPPQQWPACEGRFKALLMLEPGTNVVEFTATPSLTLKIHVVHIPLLQNPPLHLAILVAKDSPLLIDCPASKLPSLTSTHSSLDAAVAKLRMTAYMWQAFTAEDLRAKQLGRRSFRLEEEWSPSTLSRHHLFADNGQNSMQSQAKVHIVRTNKTVAELHEEQNSLYEIFAVALKKYGGVFASSARPVVAGLVLDTHYSIIQRMVHGNTMIAGQDPNGLSMGIMGSHTTHAWPRFVEEITHCLSDTTIPGDLVSDLHGQWKSMWQVCASGQESLLRQVGYAFAIPTYIDLLAPEGPVSWSQSFMTPTLHLPTRGVEVKAPGVRNAVSVAAWNLNGALKLRAHGIFWLPKDPVIEEAAPPTITVQDDPQGPALYARSTVGLIKVSFNGVDEPDISVLRPVAAMSYTLAKLESIFDRSDPLQMEVLDVNGEHKHFNVWTHFKNKKYVRVPGTSIKLTKTSVGLEGDVEPGRYWEWAVMLKKRKRNGSLVDAKKIDIRVGAVLDGAEVYYKDGSKMPCGPRWDESGQDSYMGGHQARKLALPASTEIVKVAVNTNGTLGNDLQGLRMWRSDGKVLGALNVLGRTSNITYLEPGAGQTIVGFYGRSSRWGCCAEFGIITAPKDVELPDTIYDLPELQNTDGGLGPRPDTGFRGVKRRHESISENSDGEDTSEDEDEGYDDGYFEDQHEGGHGGSDEGDDTMDEE